MLVHWAVGLHDGVTLVGSAETEVSGVEFSF